MKVEKNYILSIFNLIDAKLMPAGSEEEIWKEVEEEMQDRWTGDWREDLKAAISAYYQEPWNADEGDAKAIEELLRQEVDLKDYL